MSYAIVFPGQGAQEVGMGKDFYDSYQTAKDAFAEADEALGFSIAQIVFNGPEDELVKTAITQPAILTASIAIFRTLAKEYDGAISPAFYAGHSLGEYTALVASGVLSLGDAVRLVNKRGQLMQDAVPLGKGAMAAIMGLDKETLFEICRASCADGGICSPANVNAPTQIVISGEAAAVERTGALAKEKGALKVIPLKVSAPFHCELMRPVADLLREEFEKYTWHEPTVPIAANFDALPKKTAAEIKEALYSQTFSPVLWVDDIFTMEAGGVNTYIECGPGNVLTGLIKRICKGCTTQALNDVNGLAKATEILGGMAK